MDHKIPMDAKTDTKTHSFRNCSLLILKGGRSLTTHDRGECAVDVFEDVASDLFSVCIRSGKQR